MAASSSSGGDGVELPTDWERGYNGLLSEAIYRGLGNHSIKLPWEDGPAKHVFCPRPILVSPGLSPADSYILEAPEDKLRQNASMDVLPLYSHQPLYASAVRLRSEDCLAPRSSDTCNFKKWLSLLSHHLDGSESGKYLKRLESPQTEECIRTILWGEIKSHAV